MSFFACLSATNISLLTELRRSHDSNLARMVTCPAGSRPAISYDASSGLDIGGNSMIMQDKNNLEEADLILKWMDQSVRGVTARY
jgi:hypothetical protein